MNHYGRFNPVRLMAVLTGLCLLLGAALDPALFQLDAPEARAVGGHSAIDVLGQLTDNEGPLFTTNGADNGPNRRGLGGPSATVVDTVNHRLFLMEANNNRVVVYDLDISDHLIDEIPDHIMQVPDFKTDADELGLPGFTDLAYDSVNNLLFGADWYGNRVLVYDVSTITGSDVPLYVLGQNDSTGVNAGDLDFFNDTDCNLTAWGMCRPQGVEYDGVHERLFVANQDQNRVTVYDLSDGIDDGEDAIYVLGQDDTIGVNAGDADFFNDGDGGTTQGVSGAAIKVAYDETTDLLYEYDGGNSRVLVWDVDPGTIANGQLAQNVLGHSDFTTSGDGLGQAVFGLNFNHSGLALDTANQLLYVVDGADNHRVMVFDVDSSHIHDGSGLNNMDGESASYVLGQPDFDTGTPGGGTSGLNEPWGISYVADRVYVGDFSNNRVMIFNTTALSNGVAAVDLLGQLNPDDTPNFDATKPNNGPNAQGLDSSDDDGGVVLDDVNHRLFVADLDNNRVMVFHLNAENELLDHTADFVLGQPDFKTFASGTTATTMNQPGGVEYDRSGQRLFVSDATNHRVLVFDVASITNGEPAIAELGQNDSVGASAGDLDFFNDGDPSTTQTGMNSTSDPFYDSTLGAERLFVSDFNNNRVMIFDLSDGITNGEPAIAELGQNDSVGANAGDLDFFNDGDPSTNQVGFHGPGGSAFDSISERLFVSDFSNGRVMVFDLSDGITDGEPAVNELGQPNDGDPFDSAIHTATQSGMNTPAGIAYDSPGQRLFVSDNNANRILVFDVSTITDGEDAQDVFGQPDFTTADENTTVSGFRFVAGVAFDSVSDTLYAADVGNNRVMIFGPTPTPTPTPTDGGGGGSPSGVGFTPGHIEVNMDDGATDSRNVLVTAYATNTSSFTGTVDVLLSNDPAFSTFVPYRYNIPGPGNQQNIWPKTIAWDLCFGQPNTTPCNPGSKTVYARFYVNVPAPTPVLVP